MIGLAYSSEPEIYAWNYFCSLEAAHNAYAEDPGVQREHVGGKAGVVGVGEEVGDRRLIKDVLHVDLDDHVGVRVLERRGQVGVVPGFETVVGGVVDAGVAFALAVVVTPNGQAPVIDVERVLGAAVEGPVRRVGQLVAFQIRVEAATAVRGLYEGVVGEVVEEPERKRRRNGGVERAVAHGAPAERR